MKEARPSDMGSWSAGDLLGARPIRDADQGTKEEILAKWQQWYRDEEGYIKRDDPESYADVVLDGTRPFKNNSGWRRRERPCHTNIIYIPPDGRC